MTGRRALAVVGLVLCVLLAGCTGSSSSTSAPTGGSPSSAIAASGGTSRSSSPSSAGSSSSSSSSSPSSAGSPSAGRSSAPVHQKLHDFRIADVTFVGSHEWALGGADCLSGSGTCDAIEASDNAGRTWRSAPAPRATIGFPDHGPSCGHDCVQHLRFASTRVGYAWGDGDFGDSFFMTTDGGQHWRAEHGRVAALEAGQGTVLRVVASPGCPPGCAYRVQVAGIGSTSWRTVRRTEGDGAFLARGGDDAYLLITQNPAGGAENATSTLFSSTTGGRSWRNRGEPCPQSGAANGDARREVDSIALSAAPGGSATVLCHARIGDTQFLATTTDAGTTFRAASRTTMGAASVTGFGAASTTVVLVAQADTFRSTDGGNSFTRLAADGGSSPGDPVYIGFASAGIGHAITDDGHGLATTTDAGATWSVQHVG